MSSSTNINQLFQTSCKELVKYFREVASHSDNLLETIFDNVDEHPYFIEKYQPEVSNPPYYKTYYLNNIPGTATYITLELRKKTISVNFYKDGIQLGLNNIGLAWNSSKNMYIGGIRMKQKEPEIFHVNGKLGMQMLILIANSVGIKHLYISDSAYVVCPFSNTEEIDIDYFSIARILAGKNGFYESFKGSLFREKAHEAKDFIKSRATQDEKALCKLFVTCVKTNDCPIDPTLCNELNKIIKRMKELLQEKFNEDGGKEILSQYVINTTEESKLLGGFKRKSKRKYRRKSKSKSRRKFKK